MKSVKVLLGLVLVISLAATGVVAAQLKVDIAPLADKAVLAQEDGVSLRFAITNTTDNEIAFLRYQTPIGGFDGRLFVVEKDGKSVPYIGRMVMRLEPAAEDWITLSAGETLDAVIDLSEAYDMRTGGRYTVRFSFPVEYKVVERTPYIEDRLEYVAGEGDRQAPEREDVDSNSLDLTIDGPDVVYDILGPEKVRGYSGCTSSQQTSLSTSRTYGRNLAAKSYNQLNGTSGSTNTLYKTWFGTYTSSRYSIVKNGFNKIYNAFGYTWTYTCTTCQSGVVAYVYPNQAYKVWICAYFHNFDSTQKGSFLLHEASHWTAVLGTDDYTYGSTNCKNLAKSSPSSAVYNADSYRYFSLSAP